jgi:hypothetical protein
MVKQIFNCYSEGDKITILKDSSLCSSSSIFPCNQSQKAINDQKLYNFS